MNKAYTLYTKVLDSRRVRLALIAISVATLLFSIGYFTWHSSLFFANIQDSILYKYLFSNFRLNDMVLPGDHANILKFPLFFIESILPDSFKIYVLINLMLVAGGVLGWAALLVYIFGRKYITLICLSLSSILLISPSLSMNFAETTIRNIEYPIGLALILAIRYVLNNYRLKKKAIVIISCIAVLFGITMAGDSFMLYSFLAGIALTLLVYSVRSRSITPQVAYSFGIVVATYIISFVVRKIITISGVASLYFAPQFNTKILPFDQVGANVSTTIHQLMGLSGADIFDKNVSLSHSLEFLNFGLFFISIIGGFMLSIKAVKLFKKHKPINYKNSFLYLSLAFTALTTVLAYIAAGYAAHKQPDGTVVSLVQERYLTLVPFLLIALLIATIKTYYTATLATTLSIIVFICTVLSIPTIVGGFSAIDQGAANTHTVISNVIAAAKADGVKTIVSGDTMGAVVRFWSKDTIRYASVFDCNRQFTHNIRKSWYTPVADSGRMALVVDRSGIDSQYWGGCTDEKLRSIYGSPMFISTVNNPAGQEPVYLWVYQADIRSHIIKN